jgi:hypothetical protein
MEVHSPIPSSPNYGVAEAIIICQNEYSVNVICPFCKTIHKHGTGGNLTYERYEYRGADCHKGEYRFKIKAKTKIS